MKYSVPLALLLITLPLGAEEDSAPDAAKVLADLTIANKAKDLGKIGRLMKSVEAAAKVEDADRAVLDGISKELKTSYKLSKGNWGTLKKIVKLQGELRSKNGVSFLKRIAFQKEATDDNHAALQMLAIDAIGKLADARMVRNFEDLCKNRNKEVAKAAYASLRHYASSNGKTRKKVAALVIKRMSMEKPSSGGQGGKSVSAEAQERWAALQPIIIKTLQGICREPTIASVDNWVEWWGENKGRSPAWKDEKKS